MRFERGFVTEEFVYGITMLTQQAPVAESVVLPVGRIDAHDEVLVRLDG